MSTKLILLTDAEVNWPARCARCGTKVNLTTAGTTIGRGTSLRPTLAGNIAWTSEIVNLRYPVCQAHARWLGIASLVTRKTGGFAAIRGMVYFFGILGLPMVPTIISRWFGQSTRVGMPVFEALFFAGAVGMVGIIAAYLKLPVRLVKQTDDTVTVKFKNDAYAAEFARLNQDSARIAP
jgi:hypothetical protein